jgi:hypothetical protein
VIIALDFDGVVHDYTKPPPGKKMGPPVSGARDAVVFLRDRGHELVIFTARGSAPEHVRKWLRYFDFPEVRVTNVKEDFDLLIDDRAVRFIDWPLTLALMETK